MTNEPDLDKWKQLETRLRGIYGVATITVGDYKVVYFRRQAGNRLVIDLYINGVMKGVWTKASELGEPVYPQGLFLRPYRTRAFKLKQYASLKIIYGKKKADQLIAFRTVAFMPRWSSPRPLISHLKKHFPDLELMPNEDYSL